MKDTRFDVYLDGRSKVLNIISPQCGRARICSCKNLECSKVSTQWSVCGSRRSLYSEIGGREHMMLLNMML